MSWRRGTLLALAVLSLVLTASGAAEAGPQGRADTAAQMSVSGKVWGWMENWLAVIRKPLSIFAESVCDQGSHIDPDGRVCILGGADGGGDSTNSDDGSHIDPDG